MIQCNSGHFVHEAKNRNYLPRILPVIALLVASPLYGAAMKDQQIRYAKTANHSACSWQRECVDGADALSKNGKPVANADVVELTTSSNAFNVLENDSDPDGDRLVITDARANYGAIAFTTEGLIGYAPHPGRARSDRIIYTVSDGHGGSAQGLVEIIAR